MALRSIRHQTDNQISLVVFVVGNVNYALEITHVREIVTPLELTALPHTPKGLAGVADHRGEVMPIIDLRDRFGLTSTGHVGKKVKWVLVEIAERPVGLIVDHVVGVLRTSGSAFRPAPDLGGGEERRAIGSVTTHDGGLVFVLDVYRFESLTAAFAEVGALSSPGPKEAIG